jgi:hypothetical protein
LIVKLPLLLFAPVCLRYTLNPKEHIANQGLYLEAVALTLNHPVTGELMEVGGGVRVEGRLVGVKGSHQTCLRNWEDDKRGAGCTVSQG